MFASQVTKEIQIDNGTVRIRKLSARSLEKASEARQTSAALLTRSFGGEVLKALRDDSAVAEAQKAKVANRYGSYDRHTVLTQGIMSWSFAEKLEAGIEDLDEEAAETLSHAILDLSLPTPAAVEEATKNV